MKCCGKNISFDSICDSISDITQKLAKNKVVRYGSNVIGVIPLVGSAVGILRIALQLFFKTQESSLYDDKDPPIRFRAIKVAQGAAEFVPVVGPAVFWVARGTYLGLKECGCFAKSHQDLYT